MPKLRDARRRTEWRHWARYRSALRLLSVTTVSSINLPERNLPGRPG
jgi:hypothetical protein